MTDCGWIVRALIWLAFGGVLGLVVGLTIGFLMQEQMRRERR